MLVEQKTKSPWLGIHGWTSSSDCLVSGQAMAMASPIQARPGSRRVASFVWWNGFKPRRSVSKGCFICALFRKRRFYYLKMTNLFRNISVIWCIERQQRWLNDLIRNTWMGSDSVSVDRQRPTDENRSSDYCNWLVRYEIITDSSVINVSCPLKGLGFGQSTTCDDDVISGLTQHLLLGFTIHDFCCQVKSEKCASYWESETRRWVVSGSLPAIDT